MLGSEFLRKWDLIISIGSPVPVVWSWADCCVVSGWEERPHAVKVMMFCPSHWRMTKKADRYKGAISVSLYAQNVHTYLFSHLRGIMFFVISWFLNFLSWHTLFIYEFIKTFFCEEESKCNWMWFAAWLWVSVEKEGIERLILFSPFNWPLYLLVMRTLHLCIALLIYSIFIDCLLHLPCPRNTKINGPVSRHLMALEPPQSWLTSVVIMCLSRILKCCHLPEMAWRCSRE